MTDTACLTPGTRVRVRDAFPPGHVRTPAYVRGCHGTIHAFLGHFPNAEEMAYGRPGTPPLPLYQVRFERSEIWAAPDGHHDEHTGEDHALILDLYEHWLEVAGETV